MFRLDFLFPVSHTDLFLPLCIIICHPPLQTSFPWPSKKTNTESCDCFNENRRRCCDTISDAADVSHSLKQSIQDMGYLFLFRHLSYMPQDIQYLMYDTSNAIENFLRNTSKGTSNHGLHSLIHLGVSRSQEDHAKPMFD